MTLDERKKAIHELTRNKSDQSLKRLTHFAWSRGSLLLALRPWNLEGQLNDHPVANQIVGLAGINDAKVLTID